LGGVGEPEFAEQVTAWLDRYFERGAIMTKVWKEVGMQIRLPDGSFLMPDSEELDPVYEHLTKRNKPLMAHFADPIEAWRPLREGSTHYRYFSNNPEWHMYGKEEYPTHEEISASLERMLEKHSELVVIGAHLGSLELAAAGRVSPKANFQHFFRRLRRANVAWTAVSSPARHHRSNRFQGSGSSVQYQELTRMCMPMDHLLPEYEKLLAQIAETCAALKAQLMEALTAQSPTEAQRH
jgi:hypothetical protein